MRKVFYVLVSTFFFISCKSNQHTAMIQTTLNQGIKGQIVWVEGNMMPSFGDVKRATPKGIEREVYIFPAQNRSQHQAIGSLYTIGTKPIKVVKTDKNGFYQADLAEGTYSIFVKEEGGLFAKEFDGKGNITPVQVKKGEYALKNIRVDYKAAY